MKQRKKTRRERRAERQPAESLEPETRGRRARRWPWVAALAVLLICGWAARGLRAKGIPVFGYRVKASYPHDPAAFCQGLVFDDGVLYESTGRYGHSSVRRERLETGQVLASTSLDASYFGEGLALFHGHLFQLTWQEQRAFVYDAQSLARTTEHTYPGEGWGLTTDGKRLVMSDGTADLRFLDPETFRELGRVHVTANGRPVTNLNELEYIDGEVYANIWQTDHIARIDPESGEVKGWIDLTGLLLSQGIAAAVDVLNGIAWDAKTRRLFVTGKYWPKLFEIELTRAT